jgi:hypothetical protein
MYTLRMGFECVESFGTQNGTEEGKKRPAAAGTALARYTLICLIEQSSHAIIGI